MNIFNLPNIGSKIQSNKQKINKETDDSGSWQASEAK